MPCTDNTTSERREISWVTKWATAGAIRGRTVVRRPDAGVASTIGNVIWFVLAGVWIALTHILLGLVLCVTIIGIPLGLGNFKLAVVAIAPLGKQIVSTNDPRAATGVVTF
jgi:uncharacterized membrane protein YccF (DUF307 family)